MANLIIKSSADNLVLQGSDASPAITVGATGTTTFAENATLSGTANALGTVATGNISNTAIVYPSGHVIKRSTYTQEEQTSHVGGTATSYTDTGMEVAHTTARSSSDSYIVYEFFTSMFNLGDAAQNARTDVTMRTVSNSTYTAVETIVDASYPTYFALGGSSSIDWYVPGFLRYNCGTSGGMGMPATKSSWAAGDTLYFRLFYKVSANTFRTCHTNGSWNITATEVQK